MPASLSRQRVGRQWLFESQLNGGELATDRVRVRLSRAGDRRYRVDLEGAYDLVGYGVKLEGSVDAQECHQPGDDD